MLRAATIAALLSLGACEGTLIGGPRDSSGRPSELGGVDSPRPLDRALVDGSGLKLDLGPKPKSEAGPKPDQGTPGSIWKPKPGTTWHWQLTGTLDMNRPVQMYDIDLFNTTAQTIATLKASGKTVICYFSAGSYEDWRPDAASIPQAARGDKMSGWNELWLDIRATSVRDVMKKRLDLAKSKGCDGVEPDNVDGYNNQTGFPLSAQDQIDFNSFLADEAHARGLSVGLKNDLEQVQQLVGKFDWALNEECVKFNECGMLTPFIQAGKAAFHVEYTPLTKSEVCPQVTSLKLDSQIKKLGLDAWCEPCW